MVNWSAIITGTDKVSFCIVRCFAVVLNLAQAGEDFDRNLYLPNIDFGTYVCL